MKKIEKIPSKFTMAVKERKWQPNKVKNLAEGIIFIEDFEPIWWSVIQRKTGIISITTHYDNFPGTKDKTEVINKIALNLYQSILKDSKKKRCEISLT